MAGFNLSTKIQLLIMHGSRHKRLKSRQIEKDFMRFIQIWVKNVLPM